MVKSFALALALAASVVAAPSSTQSHGHASSSWSGWKNVKQFFVFGDSYTQTGFDVHGAQPNDGNPFGNPKYPGHTSSNGPNWVGFLTTLYNASTLYTYNLASGGATVDSALVTPYRPTVLSLKDQIQHEFLPTYGNPNTASAPWSSHTSLFAFFIGINDVGNSWSLPNATTLHDAIFVEYTRLVESVYAVGARNFLFLSVPPVQLAPLTTGKHDGHAVQEEGRLVAAWNARLERLAQGLKAQYADVNVFLHDTYGLFEAVIREPGVVRETAEVKDVTTYCKAYMHGTPMWYTKYSSCEYAVNEYFWLNGLHPTWPVHNATAASITALLKGKPTY